FEPDPFDPFPTTPSPPPAPINDKPKDSFSTPPLLPYTLFYLATIRPHTDTHTIIGPVKAFLHLDAAIMSVVNTSPKAITKLSALRTIDDVWGDSEANAEFAERGFGTFVVEGQRGVYTVLKVLRQVSKRVWDALPSPVYTVTSHGPLTPSASKHSAQGNFGYAKGTRLVGSFVERKAARKKAQEVMEELVKGVERVKVSEMWEEGGKGGGMVMAMVPGLTWEVRVAYEDQVHKRAREEVEREG
ncbi:hypothetical protein CC86DRAFT_247202, partial [Ophiobolus disseminans]